MNMTETFSKYTNSIQTSTQQTNFNFSLLFSVIIFVAVLAFVFVYVRNFMKGFKLQDLQQNHNKESNNSKQDSISKNLNSGIIYCNTCGQENDADSKFCKNCGSRLR